MVHGIAPWKELIFGITTFICGNKQHLILASIAKVSPAEVPPPPESSSSQFLKSSSFFLQNPILDGLNIDVLFLIDLTSPQKRKKNIGKLRNPTSPRISESGPQVPRTFSHQNRYDFGCSFPLSYGIFIGFDSPWPGSCVAQMATSPLLGVTKPSRTPMSWYACDAAGQPRDVV